MAKPNMWKWIAGIGVAVAGLSIWKRKGIAGVVNDLYFKASLPSYAQPYADVILRVSREQDISPFIVYALGNTETRWGTSSYLDRPGPSGRGDGGHGYGLMQIDDRSFGMWLASHDWTDPYTNVSKGAEVLKAAIAFFESNSVVKGYTDGTTVSIGEKSAAKRGVEPGNYPDPRPLYGDVLTTAAIAAYNTGAANVLMSLAAGVSPDVTTANGRYSGTVASAIESLQETYAATSAGA